LHIYSAGSSEFLKSSGLEAFSCRGDNVDTWVIEEGSSGKKVGFLKA
jgi:hypothetical protein